MSSPLEKLSYLLRFWNLTLEKPPLETGSGIIVEVSWCNQPCILKIGQDDGDEKTSTVLKHYDGNGAVQLIKFTGRASLIERAVPGTHLSELVHKGEDDRATHILCDVIEKLHANKNVSGINVNVANLKANFELYLHSNDTQIPQELISEAQSIYRVLIKSQERPLILHGDLHHDNVLYDEKKGWLAIDPKGYIGEPCYEIGALLRNSLEHSHITQDSERLNHRVSIICERLGFERERVIAWAFSQAVLAGIWSVQDGLSPKGFVEVALAFKRTFKVELDFS